MAHAEGSLRVSLDNISESTRCISFPVTVPACGVDVVAAIDGSEGIKQEESGLTTGAGLKVEVGRRARRSVESNGNSRQLLKERQEAMRHGQNVAVHAIDTR